MIQTGLQEMFGYNAVGSRLSKHAKVKRKHFCSGQVLFDMHSLIGTSKLVARGVLAHIEQYVSLVRTYVNKKHQNYRP